MLCAVKDKGTDLFDKLIASDSSAVILLDPIDRARF